MSESWKRLLVRTSFVLSPAKILASKLKKSDSFVFFVRPFVYPWRSVKLFELSMNMSSWWFEIEK